MRDLRAAGRYFRPTKRTRRTDAAGTPVADVLAEIHVLRQDGETLRGIGAVMNHRGLKTHRGLSLAAGARGAHQQTRRAAEAKM